jgi:heme/copper-type cytochrome/quinol oxidase subunit 3
MVTPNANIQLPVTTYRRRSPLLPNSVFGTLIFVATEVIFFTALLSAFLIIKAGTRGWDLPPEGRLPMLATAASTGLLLLSGLYAHLAGRQFGAFGHTPQVRLLLGLAGVLAAVFVLIQGYEWVQLLRYGMTLAPGMFAACFCLVIGIHGIHAVAAVVLMGVAWQRLRAETLQADHLWAMQIFWYFVVGIWPVIYLSVYF